MKYQEQRVRANLPWHKRKVSSTIYSEINWQRKKNEERLMKGKGKGHAKKLEHYNRYKGDSSRSVLKKQPLQAVETNWMMLPICDVGQPWWTPQVLFEGGLWMLPLVPKFTQQWIGAGSKFLDSWEMTWSSARVQT